MNNKTNTMYDIQCERLTMGTLMSFNWAYSQEAERLCEELFTDPICKQCMRAILLLAKEKGKGFDFDQVYSKIKTWNDDINVIDIIEIQQNRVISNIDFANYVGRLNDLLTRRKIYQLGENMLDFGSSEKHDLDECLTFIKDRLDEIMNRGIPAGTSNLTEAIHELEQHIIARQEGKLEDTGTATGFHELDDEGGFMPHQLIVIGAATSQGKTAFALSLVANALTRHVPIAFFSLEMGHRELAARFMAMKSGISSNKQLHPSRPFTKEEYITYEQTVGQLGSDGDHLIFDDRFTSNIDTICGAIRSMVHSRHIKGVVIDYLQILNVNQRTNNREQLMGDVARQLKNLAVELDIWILALSQFNRDTNSYLPSLNRMRDSGQIAEAADKVLLLYRPEAYPGALYPQPFENVSVLNTAMIDVAKNRNGRLLRFIVGFNAERTLFHPMEKPETHTVTPPKSPAPRTSKSTVGFIPFPEANTPETSHEKYEKNPRRSSKSRDRH